jgi:hypothetical protein
VDPQLVCARLERQLARTQDLALGCHLDGGARPGRRTHGDIDWEPLAGEGDSGKRDGIEMEVRLGTAAERIRVDRDSELARLPSGAGDAAEVLAAVCNENEARHAAGRQGGDAVADSGFEIGAAARGARRVLQFPSVFALGRLRRPGGLRERNDGRPVSPTDGLQP